jgi:hypothetical protein
MKKAIAFISSNFSTFLVGLVFSLGCGCCCECENEQVSFITIDLSFFPAPILVGYAQFLYRQGRSQI